MIDVIDSVIQSLIAIKKFESLIEWRTHLTTFRPLQGNVSITQSRSGRYRALYVCIV